jgi:hypothetical protein
MEQPNEAVSKQYAEAGAAIEAQLRALGGAPEVAAAVEYGYTGSLAFVAAGSIVKVVASFDYHSGVRLLGDMPTGGGGIGTGTSFGGGKFFVEPGSLHDVETDCYVTTFFGSTYAEWWLNGKKIGWFLGPGLGWGGAHLRGKMKWRKR